MLEKFPRVKRANGTYFYPKNLSWILRHWTGVGSIGVLKISDGFKPVTKMYADYKVIFWARHPNSTWASFEDYFADGKVLKRWLDRPVFRGLPVTWNCSQHFVGGQLYKDIIP